MRRIKGQLAVWVGVETVEVAKKRFPDGQVLMISQAVLYYSQGREFSL